MFIFVLWLNYITSAHVISSVTPELSELQLLGDEYHINTLLA